MPDTAPPGRAPGGPAPVPAGRPPLRVLLLPGTTPGRWVRSWGDRRPDRAVELVHGSVRDQLDLLRDGHADVGLVRLAARPDGFSAIRLYDETTVVVVPKGHLVTAADVVGLADLADETVLAPDDDALPWVDGRPGRPPVAPTGSTADAVALVAAGVGVLVVPQSLARLHDHRDVTYRPVTDAPTSSVWLAWVTERTDDDVEEFVGIVRGRTANSSRGPRPGGASDDGGAPGAGSGRRPHGTERGARPAPAARGGGTRGGGTDRRRGGRAGGAGGPGGGGGGGRPRRGRGR